MSERELNRGRRADKKQLLRRLEMRATSMIAQIRRDLGGGYVESIQDLKVERAQRTMEDLKEVVQEARTLATQIDELNRLIDG